MLKALNMMNFLNTPRGVRNAMWDNRLRQMSNTTCSRVSFILNMPRLCCEMVQQLPSVFFSRIPLFCKGFG